jgi:tetratricopeptide (TPR) repeat protein
MSMPRYCLSATMALALGLAAGCASRDTRAAEEASDAQTAYDQGRIPDAIIAINQALAARDDVLDYWLLKAHIALKAGDRASAYSAYEYVIQLDHGNMEALQELCQLGLAVGDVDGVDKYADQMLLLTPNAAIPLAAKGNAALRRSDTATALAFANRVLGQDPNDIGALILKARVMIAGGDYAGGANLIEKAPDSDVNTLPKLVFLKEVYIRSDSRTGYEATVRRLAAASPRDPDVQLGYADLLYQQGHADAALAVVRKVMTLFPHDLRVAAAALNVWMETGPAALDPARMVAEAAGLSLVMKADFAEFANETGHPDVAIAVLQGADQGEPTLDNSNAKAALAYAVGLKGHTAEAMARLNAILDEAADSNQPFALLARARLLAASHAYENALRDARLLVVNDPKNVSARLALADILQASGQTDLGESALREGIRAIPEDTRIAGRLAAMLAARGDKAQAAAVVRDLIRIVPMDQRANRLAQAYGGGRATAARP